MPYIVPDICLRQIVSQRQSSLETAQRHIILASIEAAQSHIVPKFSRAHSTLQESLVETKGYLRLISVEVVRGDGGNSFNAVVLIREDLLIH